MIRRAEITDAKQITDIYNYFVINSAVTFDQDPFESIVFEERIKNISKKYPFFVFELEDEILGYTYANKWREKPSYQFSVESTVYVKHSAFNKGIGSKLYQQLINELKLKGFKVVVGGLTLPNEASVKLHEKLGFKKVGHFPKVGLKFNNWYDVGFWQLDFH